jgi:hypothetical protein
MISRLPERPSERNICVTSTTLVTSSFGMTLRTSKLILSSTGSSGRLSISRPPFVPRVSGDQSITKYFNDEAGILSESDYLDSSSYASDGQWRDGAEEADKSIKPQRESKFKRWNIAKHTADDTAQAKAPEKIRRRKKEKKRLRDKLLRDPEVGRTVLELRKKGLFIGYAYRRPRFAMPEMSDRAWGEAECYSYDYVISWVLTTWN